MRPDSDRLPSLSRRQPVSLTLINNQLNFHDYLNVLALNGNPSSDFSGSWPHQSLFASGLSSRQCRTADLFGGGGYDNGRQSGMIAFKEA